MQRSLDSKLGRYINLTALATLIASVLTIYFFVGALNRNAAENDRTLLAAGFEAAMTQNEAWVVDYGWWDDNRIIIEREEIELATEVMGSSFSDHAGFDVVAAASKNDGYIVAWSRDRIGEAMMDLISAADMSVLRQDLVGAYETGETVASHFMFINDRPYIVSATVLGEYEDRASTDPLTFPILVMGSEINAAFLANIEDHFMVSDVSWVEAPARTGTASVELVDEAGHFAGHVSFAPAVPGFEILKLTLAPVVLYIALVMLVSQLMARKAGRLARDAEANERLAQAAARTDNLTGLPNRQGFSDYIQSDVARTAAANGEAAIIYIDLNGFKAVNDKAGHDAGDAVLREVGRRFRQAAGEDIHIARIGGDEFAVALLGAKQTCEAVYIARNLQASLEGKFEIRQRLYDIGAAIGISWSEPDALKPIDQIVTEADTAMYRAKTQQLDQPLCYDIGLGLEQDARRCLEADIERGLAKGEFSVVYQPIVDAQSGETASVEALLRWTSPERGAVPPDVFIPVAEETKLIRALGDFVMESVCREIGPAAPFTVSINLSPTQLRDPDLCDRYARMLDAAGMAPSAIELELTEAVLVDDFDQAKARLEELSGTGFRVNLDDFGTGFASMGYLAALPFAKIKIDKSYIATVEKGSDRNKMLQAMALLGDALNIDMVAEGVETDSQARLLRLLGFEYLQGWHFGRPVPAEELDRSRRNAA